MVLGSLTMLCGNTLRFGSMAPTAMTPGILKPPGKDRHAILCCLQKQRSWLVPRQPQRIVRASARSEPKRAAQNRRLEEGPQQALYGRLQQPVFDGGDAQPSELRGVAGHRDIMALHAPVGQNYVALTAHATKRAQQWPHPLHAPPSAYRHDHRGSPGQPRRRPCQPTPHGIQRTCRDGPSRESRSGTARSRHERASHHLLRGRPPPSA